MGTLAAGLVNATLPKFTADLGLGAGGYGWALGVLGCGMIAGEALTGAIAERIEPRWLAAGLAGMGCLFFVFAWSGSTLIALLALAAFGVANGFTEVVMMTAIHQEAATTYQGRVFGIGSTVWRTTMLGAVALAPAINAIASPARGDHRCGGRPPRRCGRRSVHPAAIAADGSSRSLSVKRRGSSASALRRRLLDRFATAPRAHRRHSDRTACPCVRESLRARRASAAMAGRGARLSARRVRLRRRRFARVAESRRPRRPSG